VNSTKSSKHRNSINRLSRLNRRRQITVRSTLLSAFAFIITGCATSYSGAAFASKAQVVQGYQQVLANQLQSAKCEKLLASKMQAVAIRFDQYHRKAGRLPEDGNEREIYQQKLSALAGENAYDLDTATAKSSEAERSGTPVRIQSDISLSILQLSDYEMKASQMCKVTRPGTITIIHNTESSYLIWGAGIDGQPIYTEDRKKAFLISHDYSHDEAENTERNF
jgi:hypothetical protein